MKIKLITPIVRPAKRGRPTLKEAARRKRLAPILKAALKQALPKKKKKKKNGLPAGPINFGMGHPKGEKHHNAKLSDKDRKKIITVWNKGAVSQGMLARQYKVNQSTIRNVLMNNQWVLGKSA